MPNKSGQAYGLTVLAPIKPDTVAKPTPAQALRQTLAGLPTGSASPLAACAKHHLARFVIVDDVPDEGAPARHEHLQNRYLAFTSNFDGELDSYLDDLAQQCGPTIEAIFRHCRSFPGVGEASAFRAYIRQCQLETTYFFAAYPDSTVADVLAAVQAHQGFTEFLARHHGQRGQALKDAFAEFMGELAQSPPPAPGSR